MIGKNSRRRSSDVAGVGGADAAALPPPPAEPDCALVAGADLDEVDCEIASTVDVYVEARGPCKNRSFGSQTSLQSP